MRVNEFFGFFPGGGVEGAHAHAPAQSIAFGPPAGTRHGQTSQIDGPSATDPHGRQHASEQLVTAGSDPFGPIALQSVSRLAAGHLAVKAGCSPR